MDAWQKLDTASAADARAMLTRCCGSRRWVETMLAARPYGGSDVLLSTAGSAILALDVPDLLEAFSHHPRIGDGEALRQRFAGTSDLSRKEQSGVQGASEEVLQALADGNRRYEEKFGYTFIVCATGRGAVEMLDVLNARLDNDPQLELRVAARELAHITRLRLEGL